jgi:hypothetical protein
MIYTSENNWYSWQYGNGPVFGRQTTGKEQFKTYFGKYQHPVKSFKEELLAAASSTLDHHPGLKPNIFFSGGVDSEIMLRAYLDIGYVPDVTIVRYENDYNIYDVSYAVTVCSILNVPYTILDMNLQKFYENDAERMSELAQIDRPRALPYCKFIEMSDGLPILGASDLTLQRTTSEYVENENGSWLVLCWEHDVGWSKFAREIDKPAVAEWFKWTPGLVMSYLNLNWFDNLIHDRYYGKTGCNSTKIIGYREAYPDLIERRKQTGFEKIDSLVDEVEKRFIDKYNGLPYRQFMHRTIDDLCMSITGKAYNRYKEI